MVDSAGHAVEMRGSMTALVTPFRDGEVDWPCVDRLVDRQIDAGTDWLVALGTTAESPTLALEERDRMLSAVVTRSAGRRPVLVGTGSNNTAEAVQRTKSAAAGGADAALVVTPSYNRPNQEGLYHHFAAVADATDLPIVLYNVPARTGVDLGNDVVVRLRERFSSVVALKDATGKLDHLTELQRRCDIAVLSGDDVLTWPCMALGGVGVVSVLGNLCPSLMKALVTAGAAGQWVEGRRIHQKVDDLAGGIGRHGPNPLPIKTAMAVMGLLSEEFRLPLCPLDEAARRDIERVLRRHEIAECQHA